MVLGLALYLAACGDGSGAVRREGEPDLFRVADTDADMNAAIAKARDTLDVFLAELQSPQPGALYSIKARFDDGEDTEHIWLVNLALSDSVLVGEVDNEPERIRTVSLGQRVVVAREKVSDWMIVSNGRYQGGYTVRVLRDRLSPAEQRRLDEVMGAKPN